jgi:hypothetical protein
MSLLGGYVRAGWQWMTGEDETPFDGDTPAWLSSMVFHVALLSLVAMSSIQVARPTPPPTLVAPLALDEIPLELPHEFFYAVEPTDQVGANSADRPEIVLSEAPVVADLSVIPSQALTPVEMSQLQFQEMIELATGQNFNENLAVRGAPVGVGKEGAVGAIDRVTHEILLSLEERKTLVVWIFDWTKSLALQRQSIVERFDRVYEELGVIQAAGNPAFKKHNDKPLLTAVYGFGSRVVPMLKTPTDDLARIKAAVNALQDDESGVEMVFTAVRAAVEDFHGLRIIDPETKQPRRNVMIIAVTDEAGDDPGAMESTVQLCRRYQIPVHVLGVPAPFGRRESWMKWVDPDPRYSQAVRWGEMTQGPESCMPERLRLYFSPQIDRDEVIDSGFGPYALTRLCHETGGLYFAIHPNRNTKREVTRFEIEPYTTHMAYFFEPEVMRRYQPDYSAPEEYARRVNENKARAALVQASQASLVGALANPPFRFIKTDEAAFAEALTRAQQEAAKLEPKLQLLHELLRPGEEDRARETVPRWRAGYDLAMGQVLVERARTESYNAMLAMAKRGMAFSDAKYNTWALAPADTISGVGSQLENTAQKGRQYLRRVVDEHPGTPWAHVARRHLAIPVGWRWTEAYTPPPQPVNVALPMLPGGPMLRPVPKL